MPRDRSGRAPATSGARPDGPSALFPVIASERLEESRDFYVELLDLEVAFESGWYTLLRNREAPAVQLGLVARDHPSVPAGFRSAPRGVIVTIEVPAVDAVHERALARGLPIVLGLRDEEFGQRHFMTRDPDGALVDVVTPIPLGRDFARAVAAFRRDRRRSGDGDGR
jgi:catechol 2,3-dioxygenase-like lactoylglutathione lyase family enzyme